MIHLDDRNNEMGGQEIFTWRAQTAANAPLVADEDLIADAGALTENRNLYKKSHSDFQRSTIRPQSDRKESLLTRALQKSPSSDAFKPDIHVTTDLSRRRSMMSSASLASTAELTSDGGLTSPARTSTPSPPFPETTYTSFAPFTLTSKGVQQNAAATSASIQVKEPVMAQTRDVTSGSPKADPTVEAAPKKRCITFACGGRKEPAVKTSTESEAAPATAEIPKRVCTIKFACGLKLSEKPKSELPTSTSSTTTATSTATLSSKLGDLPSRQSSRSPSITRKTRPAPPYPFRSTRESTSYIRRPSQSPTTVRAKPKYIATDEKNLQSSEATRFHEFASEEMQEDDWIRKESDLPMKRLTINDTLKMENAIRQLGSEVEEEAEDEEDEEDQDGNEFDDEENEDDTIDGSEDDASDGNETDNEAGFADSDDESDADGEFAFWTPGRTVLAKQPGEPSTYRASIHRTASASSIDSLNHMSPIVEVNERTSRRPKPSRRIKIRPGTPDLPDSTDFVCGTLDEDRPLEDAYVSCMEARKREKHRQWKPQDVDPSFPTSDPEDEADEHHVVEATNDSDDHVWIHGKFEDSDEEPHGRRRSTTTWRSPAHSPKRLHSPPPPAKHRLRSPPPRKLFGHSPKRMRSPPPARTIRSPAASPMTTASGAIDFAPLASRPGLTHTKSLPRTPNAFCRQYRASRIVAANGYTANGSDNVDGHVRGAMDIVKGLEKKRQRRKEKFYQRLNRTRKVQPERKPLPGRGAERMRELGLLMAGKQTGHHPYMLSA